MKHKVIIRRVEIFERGFIVEAEDKDEALKNAKLAMEQDLATGYLQDKLTEDVVNRADWIRPAGLATEEDIHSLIEMDFEKPEKD